MIYILDGCDGSGKTTLANKILETTLGATRMHFGAPKTDEEAFNYWQVYSNAIASVQPGQTVVFDRSWISDMVYGPIIRNRSEMSFQMYELLCSQVIAKGGGMIIFCTANTDLLWRRCRQRGETFVKSKETIAQLHDAYEELFKKLTILPKVRYDTGK